MKRVAVLTGLVLGSLAQVLGQVAPPAASAPGQSSIEKPGHAAGHSESPALAKIAKEAAAAQESNRIDDAIALYKKGLALRPSWEDGWWYLGTLYYDLDQYPEGRDAFKHFSLIKPDIAVGWGMLGLCEFETKQYEDAYKHLRRGITMGVAADQSVSDVMHYHFALLLTRNSQFEDALKILALFAQRKLDQPAYVEAEGLAALRKPLLPSEMPPTEREMVMEVGRAMYDASALKIAEAAAEFNIIADKYTTQPNIHYLYGSFLLYSNVDEGLAQLKRELEISPAHVPALVTLASEYLKAQDYKTALPYAEKAAEIDPQSFPAHAVLGRILCEGNLDGPRGLKELETARQLAPGSPQVRMALASAYSKAGRKEDAAKERQEFLKLRKIADENNKAAP